MNLLDKFVGSVKDCEVVVIVDEAVNPLTNTFLRSLPFARFAGIDRVTFPRARGRLYDRLAIERLAWSDARELVNDPSGGYAVVTNQWVEGKWTCRNLLSEQKKPLSKGIILIANKELVLNQDMRKILDGDLVTSRTEYSYSTLIDELAREIGRNLHLRLTEGMSPLMLESLSYLATVDSLNPSTIHELTKLLEKPRGHYLDTTLGKLATRSLRLRFEEIVDLLYWQLGCEANMVSTLTRSWLTGTQMTSEEYDALVNRSNENRNNVLSKVSASGTLVRFFSRNIGGQEDGEG